MNEQEINLSIIREVRQHPHDHDGIDELLDVWGSHKKSCPQSEIDLQQLFLDIDRNVDERRENQLTAKLKMVRQYVYHHSIELGEYMQRKFKNLVRCVLVHQTTLEEDYYLLFRILLDACYSCRKRHGQFLHQLSLATSKLPGEQVSPFSAYLEIIYHLVRIKMAGYETKNVAVARLRKYCEGIEWRWVQVFPLKDIIRTHFDYEGEFRDFQFLSALTNGYREVKLGISSRQVDIPLMLKLENETEDAKETREGSLKIESHKPKMEISKLIEELQKGRSLDKQLQDSINSISLIQIKKQPEGKTTIRRLLHLSFIHLKLMSTSIEKALYIFQIDEFINQIKNLLHLHSSSQNLADAKRIIKKQLKNYCGKDSLYYWSKIEP